MRTEAECPPEARYLCTDALYSDKGLQTMQADCVQRYQRWNKDAAYRTFVAWTRQPNEVVVFTGHAYADLALPKQFDCIFHVDNPQKFLVASYALTQSVIELAGGLPINRVEHGHEHRCVLTFEQAVPTVFQLLHQADGKLAAEPPRGAFKLGFCQAANLPAIAAEHERVDKLRAQHGAMWWKLEE